jgi:hypothetical protein
MILSKEAALCLGCLHLHEVNGFLLITENAFRLADDALAVSCTCQSITESREPFLLGPSYHRSPRNSIEPIGP